MKQTHIGLFGFGVVGEGIYNVLKAKPQLGASIEKVVIKHEHKKRSAPQSIFSTDPNTILEDTSIDLVVELIDDATAALDIVIKAMMNGKSVISANKKMIAENLSLLAKTAYKQGVSFIYEAAVCGSIPIIRNLEEYFNNDLITNVTGIVNGSTNYILTQMTENGLDYNSALIKAQELGFAESDPGLDVDGWDARNKLKIITLHAFGKLIRDQDIQVNGIRSITEFDMAYAKEKGYVIKLLATCRVDEKGNIREASVLPTFVPKFHPLRATNNEFNGVLIGGELADEQFLYGKGAGRYPTSSAVLSDISAYTYNYRYEYKKKINLVNNIIPSTKKFYVSFENGCEIDFTPFGEIKEEFKTKHRCYIILEGKSDIVSLLKESPGVSVISHI